MPWRMHSAIAGRPGPPPGVPGSSAARSRLPSAPDVSWRTPVSKVVQSDSRGSDGRFVNGNPGGPGRPRRVVKAAADALDGRAAEAAPELFDAALERARGGSLAPRQLRLD